MGPAAPAAGPTWSTNQTRRLTISTPPGPPSPDSPAFWIHALFGPPRATSLDEPARPPAPPEIDITNAEAGVLTVPEAASVAGVSERAMQKWVAEGKVIARKAGDAPNGAWLVNALSLLVFLRKRANESRTSVVIESTITPAASVSTNANRVAASPAPPGTVIGSSYVDAPPGASVIDSVLTWTDRPNTGGRR